MKGKQSMLVGNSNENKKQWESNWGKEWQYNSL